MQRKTWSTRQWRHGVEWRLLRITMDVQNGVVEEVWEAMEDDGSDDGDDADGGADDPQPEGGGDGPQPEGGGDERPTSLKEAPE